jgi:RHS repeat-associated protein
MGARYYEAGTGRFLSQDPAFWSLGNGTGLKPINSQEPSAYISDPQKLNSYSYAENNPISKYDPTGTFSINIFGFLPESTQVSIGNAAQYLYDNNGTWRTAMDHPVVAGASIGVLSGASAYAGAAGLTYLSINSLGGIGTACIALCGQTSQQLDRAADYVGRYGPELGSKMNQISNRLGDKDYDEHAILRMAERNVSVDRVENLLHTKPFEYFHDGQTKLGYYDEASKLFVAQSKAGHVITVISNASQKYVNGLIGN